MDHSSILFATSNKGKFAWLERALKIAGLDIPCEMQSLDLLEIQSDSIEEISLHKARQAYALTKRPILVMDGGFYIRALNGFPGPFARYMFDQMGADAMAKLAGTLSDTSCYFKNVATYVDVNGHAVQFDDHTGDIFNLTTDVWPHDHPKQWSSLWRLLVPAGLGYTKPLAAMSDEELDRYAEERLAHDADNSCLNKFIAHLIDIETKQVAHA